MVRNFFAVLVMLAVSSVCWGQSLTFLTPATLTIEGVDYTYKAYIDLPSLHTENGYPTVDLYSHFDSPITLQGYTGVRWWKNTFQADCSNNRKHLTYIAYLDEKGNVIVDQKITDDPWEPFNSGEVNSRVKPFLCQQ